MTKFPASLKDGTAEAPERVRGSGARIVHEQLRDWILNLTLPPGSPIDEVELSERFGMSRTPVREALVRLAAEGLVVTLPNRSTIVANIDFLNLHTFFDALTLMYRVTTRLAGEFRTEADLVTFRALQAEYVAAVAAEDALAMISANRELHAAIAEAGRNPYYLALFTRLLDEGRRILRVYYSSFDDRLPRQYSDEHEQMIAAIAAQDIEACDRIATAHADQIVRQIQNFIARDNRRPISI